ncbi:hypothetical protein DFH94DRAFT_778796 [Russula ochroleuca]|jgi:hypothetical protein|uniref:Uncharacterized protein n=1 Tax=Russula ochroleuca TaxID=152965 RepID=A0A9P5JVV6_9AGAM|nr:hypothetical protein DFH94DRAFT_778796 [Russula ochroleuca]
MRAVMRLWACGIAMWLCLQHEDGISIGAWALPFGNLYVDGERHFPDFYCQWWLWVCVVCARLGVALALSKIALAASESGNRHSNGRLDSCL